MRKLIGKENLKKEVGITLIALIITVIIMLVLAGVTISALTGNESLFEKTQVAVDTYNQAVQNETEKVASLLNEIDSYLNKMDNSVNIYTKEDLIEFREDVNNGNNYEGVTVNLMNDIYLGGDENDATTWWNPIGCPTWVSSQKNYFRGVFNGNDYEISGIYNNFEEGNIAVGFFAGIGSATIKNLTLSGDFILAEYIEGEKNLAAGGFAGGADGNSQILNCKNKINITKNSDFRDVAGFVNALGNNATLTIKNCINYGNMTGSNNCGGFVGNVYQGKKLIIEDCCNEGNITNYVANHAGGLIGRDEPSGNSTIIINNSYNKGVIRARSVAGGLAGYINHNIIINNSYNIGEIHSEQRIASTNVGGLIGQVWETSSNCIVINSYNNANIFADESPNNVAISGLIGKARADIIDIINCYNLGNIENATYGSGICLADAPSNTSPTLNMKNCYNKGSINGTNTSGLITLFNSPITVNMDKVYYLNSISNVGISEYFGTNSIQDTTTPLSEAEMKASEFVEQLNNNLTEVNNVVSELNDNVRDLNIQFTLKRWKHTTDNYPSFE